MATNVSIPDDLHADLKSESKESGMRITVIVERAIRQWLAAKRKKK